MPSSTRSLHLTLAFALLFALLFSPIAASPVILEARRGGGFRSSSSRGSSGGSSSSSGGSSSSRSGGSSGASSEGSSTTWASGSTHAGGLSPTYIGYYAPWSNSYYRPVAAHAPVRQNASCVTGDCAGALPNGDIVNCQTQGPWFGFAHDNFTAACQQWDYNSTAPQSWTQTARNDGGPLVDGQGKGMSIGWTAQITQMRNNTLASCIGALENVATACQGTSPDTEGGVYTFEGNTASYAFAPQSGDSGT